MLAPAVIERKGRGGALVLSAAAVEVYAAVMRELRPLDPQHEKARRDHAAADLAEHRLAVEKREFLPATEVERGWSILIAGCRTTLLSFPTTSTAKVCHAYELGGHEGVYVELSQVVRDALTVLADPETHAPCPHCGADIWAEDLPAKPRRATKKKAKRKRRKKAAKKRAKRKTRKKTTRRKRAKKTRTK